MRKILTNPFINHFPKLDVHGLDQSSVNIIVAEFIKENLKLHQDKIIIIHGLGTGILKNEIHLFLGKSKDVRAYYLDNWNIGRYSSGNIKAKNSNFTVKYG